MSNKVVLVPKLRFNTVEQERRRLLQQFKNTKHGCIYLDLAQVTSCDSAGLALLIEARRLAAKYNKQMIMESVPNKVKTLAEFCGVEWSIMNS